MPDKREYSYNKMGELLLNNASVSVVSVYEIATDIAKQCEKLIELYGSDAVTGLIPKVINALELLEALASQNERETTLVQELNDRIAYLESEKNERTENRKRYEKELEAIEEQWRTESHELLSMISKLQDANHRLAKENQQEKVDLSNLTNSTGSIAPTKDNEPVWTNNGSATIQSDAQVLQRLRTQIDKNRDELKLNDRTLNEKSLEIENLNLQIDRLKNSGCELRRRQKLFQLQIRTLCEERADFLAQLQDQQREIVNLKKRLGIAEKENEDLEDENSIRPRYTTAELKDIFSERDDLKNRIDDLEEELKTCKPASLNDKSNTPPEDEPPVQGPLPYEPEDAPWRKADESGIRKFFRKLFSEPGAQNFPRRSLSTLSKMALSSGPHSDIPI